MGNYVYTEKDNGYRWKQKTQFMSGAFVVLMEDCGCFMLFSCVFYLSTNDSNFAACRSICCKICQNTDRCLQGLTSCNVLVRAM